MKFIRGQNNDVIHDREEPTFVEIALENIRYHQSSLRSYTNLRFLVQSVIIVSDSFQSLEKCKLTVESL